VAPEGVDITWRARRVNIEYAWLNPAAAIAAAPAPLMIFLHEGLGSLAMWKDFPQQLCDSLGCRGLVYSRPGYGQSSPRGADETWAPDFMHQQAHEVLPALLHALGVNTETQKPWLFGHSDGGSIALLYAARFVCAGAVLLAPHILVEDISVSSIAATRQAYINSDGNSDDNSDNNSSGLKSRLARYHTQPDSAFWGWADVWLSPAFRHWNIEADIATISCPLLAVQGLDDEYGSLAQIRGIQRLHPGTRLLELAHCGHSPHRDQPHALLAATQHFFQTHVLTH
jgi:pimeloyl-ACP methyl ester carboxylesterase